MFDETALLEDFAGDEDILREACAVFLKELNNMLGDVRAALAAGDLKTLERAAHSLKGAASNFRADSVTQAAQALETAAKQGQIADAPAKIAALEGLAVSLGLSLKTFLEGTLSVSA